MEGVAPGREVGWGLKLPEAQANGNLGRAVLALRPIPSGSGRAALIGEWMTEESCFPRIAVPDEALLTAHSATG